MLFWAKKDISQTTKFKDHFYFPTFHLGGDELPSLTEMHDEVCDRHL